MAKELTSLVVVERSKKGPGFDYWLGQSDDDDLFANKARLEVSGILAGNDSDIKGRTMQKVEILTLLYLCGSVNLTSLLSPSGVPIASGAHLNMRLLTDVGRSTFAVIFG